MSSISVDAAKSVYGGTTREETIRKMATEGGYRRIYVYANDYGDKKTHTDYCRIQSPGDAKEREFLSSRIVHKRVLVYDNEEVVNLDKVRIGG